MKRNQNLDGTGTQNKTKTAVGTPRASWRRSLWPTAGIRIWIRCVCLRSRSRHSSLRYQGIAGRSFEGVWRKGHTRRTSGYHRMVREFRDIGGVGPMGLPRIKKIKRFILKNTTLERPFMNRLRRSRIWHENPDIRCKVNLTAAGPNYTVPREIRDAFNLLIGRTCVQSEHARGRGGTGHEQGSYRIENVYRNTMTNRGERYRGTVPPKGMMQKSYEPCALRRSRAHSTKSSIVDGHAAAGWEGVSL